VGAGRHAAQAYHAIQELILRGGLMPGEMASSPISNVWDGEPDCWMRFGLFKGLTNVEWIQKT
jgi:hypothetical protein